MSYIGSSLGQLVKNEGLTDGVMLHMLQNMGLRDIKTPLLECVHLMRSTKRVIAAFDRCLDPYGITINQWEALSYIDGKPAIRPIDFAEDMGTSRSTAMRSLRLLEKAGLIKQTQNQEDARSILLEVTPQGRRRMEKVSEILEKFSNEVTSGISKIELKTLSSILGQIVQNTKVEEL